VLTFFSTAKPFLGHAGIIQRNALESWTRLHPDVEVILFGDDDGAAEAARDLKIRHEPHVERSGYGSKRLDYMFSTARAIARHEVLCYINCDIVLTQDFRRALEQVRAAHSQFLMVGRRWDVDITQPWDFTRANWQSQLQSVAYLSGWQRPPEWIDYFAFSRDLYGSSVPPFVVGRGYWDNWLLWKARDSQQPVVDVSPCVMAVHQNHDYSYHPRGKLGVWHDQEAQRNHQLAGGWLHLRTIADATEVLCSDGLKPNTKRHWATAKRYATQGGRVLRFDVWQPVRFFALGITRPLRHSMGLRREAFHRRSRDNA